MKKNEFLKLAKKAKEIAEDKKGEDVIIIDVKDLTSITNYFVIITANSTPQINAISSEIEKVFKYDYETPAVRKEAKSGNWFVLDFGGVLVHIMNSETRLQYELEKIWLQPSGKKTKKTKKKISAEKE
jgi:ribosome-associated protein